MFKLPGWLRSLVISTIAAAVTFSGGQAAQGALPGAPPPPHQTRRTLHVRSVIVATCALGFQCGFGPSDATNGGTDEGCGDMYFHLQAYLDGSDYDEGYYTATGECAGDFTDCSCTYVPAYELQGSASFNSSLDYTDGYNYE